MRTYAAIPTLFIRDKLRDVIASLETQTVKPDKIVLITPKGNLPKEWEIFLSQHKEIEVCYLDNYTREEVLNKKKNSMVASRNYALSNARKIMSDDDLIIFIDDDGPLDPNWIEVAEKNLADKENGGFTGRIVHYRDSGRQRKFEEAGLNLIKFLFGSDRIGTITDCGFVSSRLDGRSRCEVKHLPGIVAYKLGAVRGIDFDENYRGNCYREETDFSVRVGKDWKLIYDPATTAHHYVGITRRDKFSIYYKNYNHIYFWKKNYKFSFCFFLREAVETLMLAAASLFSLRTDYLDGIKGKIDAYRKYLLAGQE
jgi:glycosyltransferase involved in cell wall biosynthesis